MRPGYISIGWWKAPLLHCRPCSRNTQLRKSPTESTIAPTGLARFWRARPPAMTGCGKPKIWRQPKKSGPGSLRQKAQSGPQRSLTLHSASISTAGRPQPLLMTKHYHRIACGCAVRHCRQRLLKLWPSSVLVPFLAMAGRPPTTSCPDWFSMNGLQYPAARWEWIPSRTKQRCITTGAR